MMIIKKFIGLLCIASVIFSCKSKPENHGAVKEISSDMALKPKIDSANIKNIDKEWLIIPGKSVGKTEINQDANLIFKKFGKPDGGDAAMGKAIAVWYSNHDSTGHSTSIYTTRDMGNNQAALIRQIRITSPVFKTKDGLGTTSDLSDIEKIFDLKSAEIFMNSGKQYEVYDAKEGIAFEMGPNKKCVAVIVHEAGKTIPGTYLKFRTNNSFIDLKNK